MSLAQTLALLILEAQQAKLQKTANDVRAVLAGLRLWTSDELPYVARWLRERAELLQSRSAALATAAELHLRAAEAIEAATRKAAA